MQVTRQHVVDILRMAGLLDLADEAHRTLPDPLEYHNRTRQGPRRAAAGPGGSLGGRVRADRAVLVRGGGGHRGPAAAVLPPVDGPAHLPRLIPVAERRHGEPGVPVRAGHQLRRPRRAADPAGASLVGGPVRRRALPAPAADVLPRPVLRPRADELADLGDTAARGHARRLHRHHPARRHAVGRQPQRDHRRAAVRAAGRDAPGVLDLRRGTPRPADHRPRLLGAHPGPPGPDRRAARWPASGRRCGGRDGCGPIRCCRSPARRWSCSARSRRSTRSGCSGRPSRAASAPVRCRTGTWRSSTAGCGSCRPGRCRSGVIRWISACCSPACSVPPCSSPDWPSTRWPTGGSPASGQHAARGAARQVTLLPPRRADLANRTAAGVASITFYGLLWAAAANDQIAYHLDLDLYTVTWAFRVLVLAGPALAFVLTRVICHALDDRRRDEELHGRETGRIVQNPRAATPRSASQPARPWKEARGHDDRRIPVRSLHPGQLPRHHGRDPPLGPGGADGQEDGQVDLLHQRQLANRVGAMVSPRCISRREFEADTRCRATASQRCASRAGRGRCIKPMPSRLPGRRDRDSRRPPRVGGQAVLRHPPGS